MTKENYKTFFFNLHKLKNEISEKRHRALSLSEIKTINRSIIKDRANEYRLQKQVELE